MQTLHRARVKKGVCLTGGFIFFAIGLAGMLLPLLPTTIFWIIAAWLFTKAHPEMYQRIITWPKIGPIIELYLNEGIIEPRSKAIACAGIIVVGGLSLLVTQPPMLWMGLVIGILAAVSLYILTRPGEFKTANHRLDSNLFQN